MSFFKVIREEIEWGGRKFNLETGRIARQADGAVTVRYGGTVALCTVVRPAEIAPVVLRDPDDDAVVSCAMAAEAKVIISGDSDLLVLKRYQEWRGCARPVERADAARDADGDVPLHDSSDNGRRHQRRPAAGGSVLSAAARRLRVLLTLGRLKPAPTYWADAGPAKAGPYVLGLTLGRLQPALPTYSPC